VPGRAESREQALFQLEPAVVGCDSHLHTSPLQ
jgi:hypothetical protein